MLQTIQNSPHFTISIHLIYKYPSRLAQSLYTGHLFSSSDQNNTFEENLCEDHQRHHIVFHFFFQIKKIDLETKPNKPAVHLNTDRSILSDVGMFL